jgi:SAM-dependent methyltransferase
MNRLWRLYTDQYGGLEMKCPIGVHEAAMGLLRRYGIGVTSVLDLGAGSGAFLKRLHDGGFSDLHAVELDVGSFGLAGVTPLPIDLNTPFTLQFDRRFGLVTALEVIEHLDCPRAFLKGVYELLEDGGTLLLSTPNVANWLGRITFPLTGDLRYFDEKQYSIRHISPITDVQMRLMLTEVGFRLLGSFTAGHFFGPLRQLATAPARLVFRLLFGPTVLGDCRIYLAEKRDGA